MTTIPADLLERSDVLSNIEATLSPWKVWKSAEHADADGLLTLHELVRDTIRQTLIASTVIIGVAVERAGYGDNMLEQLAARFGYHKSQVSRCSHVWNDLIKPRLEAEGEAASFPLHEASWYYTIVQSAKRLERQPLDLLVEVENTKHENPSYSQRQFREKYGLQRDSDEGSIQSEAQRIARALKLLSQVDENACSAFVNTNGALAKHLAEIEGAKALLDRIAADLRARIGEQVMS